MENHNQMSKRPVNPRAITTAMTARGVTQNQLAEELNITQGALSRLLSGDLYIKPETYLEQIATYLNYPIKFFYEDIKVLPRYTVYYRRRMSMGQGELNKLHYSLYIQKHALKKLLENVEITTNVPYVNPEKNGTPERIAEFIRQRWNVPRGPIKNLINLIESAGIFVLWFDSNNDLLDGLVLPDEDGLPVIVINKNMPPDKQRFTVAHEVGHLLMHTGDFFPDKDLDYEKQAHRFAAELLMPKQDIFTDLMLDTSFPGIASLKAYWKVSIAALVRRAYDLGIITRARYTSLNVQLSREGYKKNEPTYGMVSEKPTLFKQIMDIHLKELEYSEQELADKMCLSLDDFRQIYDTYTTRPFKFKISQEG